MAGLLATGCKTYQEQNRVIHYWQQGSLTNAAVEATKQADKNANNKDAIIWRLEQGATLRANGQYEDSNKAFDAAQEKMDDYAQKAKVRLGQETGAPKLLLQAGFVLWWSVPPMIAAWAALSDKRVTQPDRME